MRIIRNFIDNMPEDEVDSQKIIFKRVKDKLVEGGEMDLVPTVEAVIEALEK